MGKVVAGVSRFGPVVRRYCLSVVYYLWEFSHPEESRARKVNLTTDASRRDLLGAVKPYVEEIEAALEDPECQGIERQGLLDFTASYEAVLELMGLPFEKVKSNWDHFQLTADARLNRTLFHVFRGLDLYQMGNLELAEGHLLPGWEKLLEIEKRRMLPTPLRQLVENNQDIVARFERDLRQYRDTGEGPGVQEFSGLPSIGHLLEEREMGRMQGLRHLEIPAPVADETPPPEVRTEGLVIALGQTSEAPVPAPEGVFPEQAAAPAAPTPDPDPTREEHGNTEVPAPNPFLDGVPGPPPSRPVGADGEPMEDSWEAITTESAPPVGVETAPPVQDLEGDDDEDNPWADVSDEPHVSVDEFLDTQAGEKAALELFPEVEPVQVSQTEAEASAEAEAEAAPTAHPSLAALFQGEEDEDDEEPPASPAPEPEPEPEPEPDDDLARAQAETAPGADDDLAAASAETTALDTLDPTSTMLRQHRGRAAKRAAERVRSETPKRVARRHSELAELFEDEG